MWNRVATAQYWKKSFTHIGHRARAVGLKGLVTKLTSSTPKYLLPSRSNLSTSATVWIPVHIVP